MGVFFFCQDTCTGFLLGGIGERNMKREGNFMIVDKDTPLSEIEGTLKNYIKRSDIDIILITQNVSYQPKSCLFCTWQLEPDICTQNVLLSGCGQIFLCTYLWLLRHVKICSSMTQNKSYRCADTPKHVLFQVAEQVRYVLDAHTDAIPAILEIPSKDCPYDPNKDSILRRAKGLFNTDDFR